jgi:hypothetical protein
MFQVARRKAQLWFVILPGLLYVGVLGVLALLFAAFAPSPA